MTDLVERLRNWLHIFNAKDLDDTLAASADEIERLQATNEWQHRALQLNSEEIERLTRELAKSVERINDFVTEIQAVGER